MSTINPSQRNKAIDAAIKSIERQFGSGAIMRMGEDADKTVPVIGSGSLSLDIALGIGGYPQGRVVEIYGPESSGKTTLTLHAIAECQKAGGTAAFVDAEHALDTVYAGKLGIDIDKLIKLAKKNSSFMKYQYLMMEDHMKREKKLDLKML